MNIAGTALVTGAGSGIGAEVSMRLARKGYHLIISGSNRSKLEALAERLPTSAAIEVIDLSQAVEVEALCESIRHNYPPLDIAFINAGIVQPGDFADRGSASIDREIDINFRSAVHLIHACIPGMKQRRMGHIIGTSSIGGILALGDCSIYSATKFALRGFLCGLQQEMAAHNIAVSGLYPGAVDTAMLRYEAENGGSPLNFLHPPASVEDVGDAFMKLLKTRKLETYVPYSDSISSRLLSCFPALIPKLLPRLVKAGEEGRTRYIQSWDSGPG